MFKRPNNHNNNSVPQYSSWWEGEKSCAR